MLKNNFKYIFLNYQLILYSITGYSSSFVYWFEVDNDDENQDLSTLFDYSYCLFRFFLANVGVNEICEVAKVTICELFSKYLWSTSVNADRINMFFSSFAIRSLRSANISAACDVKRMKYFPFTRHSQNFCFQRCIW